MHNFITSKDLITTRTLRNVSAGATRNILSGGAWRKQKAPIQSIAFRSQQRLVQRFKNNLVNSIASYNDKEISFEELLNQVNDVIKESYKLSYRFGLKASGSGLGLYHSGQGRIRTLNPGLYKNESEWIDNSLKDSMKTFITLFKSNNFSTLFNFFSKNLEINYNYGRLAGSGDNVLIYWATPNTQNCTKCTYIKDNSPWTKDTLPGVPGAISCSCGISCSCSFTLLPKSNIEVLRVRASKNSKKY